MNSRIFNFAKELASRRCLHDSTVQQSKGDLVDFPVASYVGFDPTAPRIHLGNYLQLVALFRGVQFGVKPIVLIGGATGGIGDPSGRSLERHVIEHKTLETNTFNMKNQLSALAKNMLKHIEKNHKVDNSFLVLDNHEFYSKMHVMDFFRKFGFHIRVSPMLGKESIAQRIHSADGITYTEFSYQIFQGIDYYHLYKKHVC